MLYNLVNYHGVPGPYKTSSLGYSKRPERTDQAQFDTDQTGWIVGFSALGRIRNGAGLTFIGFRIPHPTMFRKPFNKTPSCSKALRISGFGCKGYPMDTQQRASTTRSLSAMISRSGYDLINTSTSNGNQCLPTLLIDQLLFEGRLPAQTWKVPNFMGLVMACTSLAYPYRLCIKQDGCSSQATLEFYGKSEPRVPYSLADPLPPAMLGHCFQTFISFWKD
jgi:hypothetical protein